MPLVTIQSKVTVEIGTNRTRRLVILKLTSDQHPDLPSTELTFTPQQTLAIIEELQTALASLPPEPPAPISIPER